MSDLFGGVNRETQPKPAKVKTKSEPKYQNPHDSSQTWSGRGRKPSWFEASLKKGVLEAAMLIIKEPPTAEFFEDETDPEDTYEDDPSDFEENGLETAQP